jgi:hypothetical protein
VTLIVCIKLPAIAPSLGDSIYASEALAPEEPDIVDIFCIFLTCNSLSLTLPILKSPIANLVMVVEPIVPPSILSPLIALDARLVAT